MPLTVDLILFSICTLREIGSKLVVNSQQLPVNCSEIESTSTRIIARSTICTILLSNE